MSDKQKPCGHTVYVALYDCKPCVTYLIKDHSRLQDMLAENGIDHETGVKRDDAPVPGPPNDGDNDSCIDYYPDTDTLNLYTMLRLNMESLDSLELTGMHEPKWVEPRRKALANEITHLIKTVQVRLAAGLDYVTSKYLE